MVIKNIKDFGAIGDGIADDSAALQAAHDWTQKNEGATLYFPPGTYSIGKPINVSETWWRGILKYFGFSRQTGREHGKNG